MDIRHLTGRKNPNSVPSQRKEQAQPLKNTDGASFSEILSRKSTLEFSGHALKRLQNRSISLDKPGMERLEEAVSRAEQKGSKDSLVLDGDHAFLINIPNKKVITAVNMIELREKVFTNIDSTVLTKGHL